MAEFRNKHKNGKSGFGRANWMKQKNAGTVEYNRKMGPIEGAVIKHRNGEIVWWVNRNGVTVTQGTVGSIKTAKRNVVSAMKECHNGRVYRPS